MLNPWLGRGVCLAVGCVIGWFAQKSQVRARGWSRLPVSPAQPLPPALSRVAAAAAADQASHCRAASNLKTVPGYLPTHYCLPQHEGEDEYDSDDSEEGQQQPVGRRGRRSAGFAAPAPAEELKMVLVVNDELKMGKGKIGGRMGGGSLAGELGALQLPPRRCFGWLPARRYLSRRFLTRHCPLLPPCLPACSHGHLLAGAQCAHAAVGAVERLHDARQGAALAQWERCGQPKICLRANSTLVSQPVSECSTRHSGSGSWIEWQAFAKPACRKAAAAPSDPWRGF